ncbi:CamS family sex pheromone protein [Cytobacillus kochii]|uniref:CamS family sex pheromone protein n=1 Tax=Cytobacillus TaxID=2675230 RepID=UPI001CD75F48|nr:CamS family sex pheromone protein [Cytobacillus kochii]MCA1028135.1 CamS family sex pheromone protein [Cytobacillus kochii]MDM5205684.1 CamS family sex pheromone protein [Cytobacillus kochii]
MRRLLLLTLTPLLLITLTACMNKDEEETTDQPEDIVIPTQIENNIFKVKQPFEPAKARGAITANVSNNYDITEIELGLMDITSEYFSPEDHLYQSGQYIDSDLLNELLARESNDTPNGLNPKMKATKDRLEDEEKTPKIISHIHEQNYLNEKGKVVGISLAISINDYYHIRVMDDAGLVHTGEVRVNDVYKDKSYNEKYAKNIAKNVISAVRGIENVPNVPIILSIYEEAGQNEITPGQFLAHTYIDKGKQGIGSWEEVEKDQYVYPSDELNEVDKSLHDSLNYLSDDLLTYFTNLDLRLNGDINYEHDNLTNIELKIYAPGISKAELTSILNFCGTKINSIAGDHVPVSIRIINVDEELGLMIWDTENKEILTEIL